MNENNFESRMYGQKESDQLNGHDLISDFNKSGMNIAQNMQ